mgnify:CR=1 FL=1
MPTYERLDYGSADGSQWGGASTDAIAFYGSTPSAQIAIGDNVSTLTATTQIFSVVSTLIQSLKTIGLFRT